MTVQTRSPLHVHVTRPGSFTTRPLTPPPTDEKHPSTVLRIVEDIRSRKAETDAGVGASRIPVPWAVYSLDTEGFRNLLQRIRRDKTLAGFAEHKLRYENAYLDKDSEKADLAVDADSITSHPPTASSFECPLPYTNSSSPPSSKKSRHNSIPSQAHLASSRKPLNSAAHRESNLTMQITERMILMDNSSILMRNILVL